MTKYMELENIESYYEQVVKKKLGSETVIKLVLGLSLIIVTMIVSIILMVTLADWLFLIVLTLFPFTIYLIYYIIKNSRVEYEYTFVLGEMRIARIKGKSKRRTITYFDVKAIDGANKPFDPVYHNAVIMEAKEGVESGYVIEVLQKGYLYKDKVIRPAMVKVSE